MQSATFAVAAGEAPSTARGRRAKDAVLTAAKELFSERHHPNISVALIAQRADVSVGTVYRYFGSKERLFVEVLRASLLQMFETARRAWSPEADFRSNLQRTTTEYLRAYQANSMVMGSATDLASESDAVRELWRGMRQDLHGIMLARLKQDQDLAPGEALDPVILMRAMVSMIDGFAHRAFVEGEYGRMDDSDLSRAARVLAEVWYRSIYSVR